MKKRIYLFLKILFISFFFTNHISAEISNKLIQKIINTNTLSFEFKQNISDKIETGKCIIKYSKLLRCDYDDTYKKRLISNGKTLVVIQRRYKKIFYYPLKTTPLNFLLDKKYLIEFIKKNKPNIVNDKILKFEILEKNKKLIIFFDRKSLNFKGWQTEDIYKNKVDFKISNLKTNIPVDKNLFKIPKEEDL